MPRRPFGDLSWYISNCSLDELAECMFSKQRFAFQGVDTAAAVEALLRDLLANTPWLYGREDFIAFIEAVIACAPDHSVPSDYAFRRAAALYSVGLGP